MRQIVLAHALSATPIETDFAVIEASSPACPDGGVVAQVAFVSLDPYVGGRLRGRHMGEPAPKPMLEAIPGAVVGQVLESRARGVREGDWVHAMDGGWAERVALSSFRVIDPKRAPPEAFLGVLGMPGLTAWAGVSELAQVGGGDVFLVNAAAGAVGGVAGQIAKLRGAERVIGLAGGPGKCAVVLERYRFDACVDSRAADWRDRLTDATPEGVAVHFENVGQEALMAAMGRLRINGRVVLCGLAAHYQTEGPPAQIPIGAIIGKRARLMGLVVYDFYPRWQAFIDEASDWLREGRLTLAEDRAMGLESAPALFARLMRGENLGKCLVSLNDPA